MRGGLAAPKGSSLVADRWLDDHDPLLTDPTDEEEDMPKVTVVLDAAA